MKKLLLLSLFLSPYCLAAMNVVDFENESQYQRYQTLIAELRCLVCQNQNLADSNAELALDLKTIVQQQILAGNSDDQILEFMTERYGDFVLYRPPVKQKTLLLWLGPLLFLVVGLWVVVNFVRRSNTQSVSISEKEQQKVKALLNNEKP